MAHIIREEKEGIVITTSTGSRIRNSDGLEFFSSIKDLAKSIVDWTLILFFGFDVVESPGSTEEDLIDLIDSAKEFIAQKEELAQNDGSVTPTPIPEAILNAFRERKEG